MAEGKKKTPVPLWGRLIVYVVVIVGATAGYTAYKRPDVARAVVGLPVGPPAEKEEANPAELAALKAAPLAPPPAPPSADPAGDWPQWLGPTRDGRVPAPALRTDWEKDPPTVAWAVPGGGGYSSPVVANGRVYVQDRVDGTDRLRCLSAADGSVVWSHDTPQDYAGIGYASGPRATPTVRDGAVYYLTGNGVLFRLDEPKAAGELPTVRWSKGVRDEFGSPTPSWGFASSPLVVDDLVVVQPGGSGSAVAAFDRDTGAVRWKAGDDPAGYSSPALATLAGVRQVVAVTGASVVGTHPADGTVLWRHPWVTNYDANIASPVAVGDYVFVSSSYSKGCALLHITGEGRRLKPEVVYFRKARVMMNHHSTCVHKDGFLYGFDTGTLRCVDMRAGEAVDDWNAKGLSGKGSVVLAGDLLVGQTETGTLFLAAADPEEFRLLGKLDDVLDGKENWATPAVVGGRIYLRDGQKVVCLDAAKPQGERGAPAPRAAP